MWSIPTPQSYRIPFSTQRFPDLTPQKQDSLAKRKAEAFGVSALNFRVERPVVGEQPLKDDYILTEQILSTGLDHYRSKEPSVIKISFENGQKLLRRKFEVDMASSRLPRVAHDLHARQRPCQHCVRCRSHRRLRIGAQGEAREPDIGVSL